MKPKIFHLGLCVDSGGIVNAMQKAFVDNSSEYYELSTGAEHVNQRSIRICEEHKPDFVFMQIQSAGIISPDTVKRIQDNGTKVLNWTGDVREGVPIWMNSFGADVTLFSNMRDVRSMRDNGLKADYLEIGYDQNIYTRQGKINTTNEIVFFGNSYGASMFPMSAYRIEKVNHLRSVYGNRFGVYGNWPQANGNFNNSQPEEAAGYRGSKIAINCSHFEIEKYSSDRLLRILGTGVPICLAKHYPGIEEDYEDGVTLRIWKNIEELKSLIDYYLNPDNEFERTKIASQGEMFVRQNFTFDHMIKNAIKIYNGL